MLHGGCKMKLRSVDSIRSTKDIRNQGLSEFIDEDGKRIQPTEAQHRLACLDAADRAAIFAGTARRLYPVLAKTSGRS